jgi:hypothetical protein
VKTRFAGATKAQLAGNTRASPHPARNTAKAQPLGVSYDHLAN